jgi:predicted small metal-binding protein
MGSKLLSALVALVITVSAVSYGQDVKKTEKKEGSKETSALMMYSCSDQCGFKVQSRDEQEVIDAAASHLKKHHNQTLSQAEIKAKLKVVGTTEKAEPTKEKPKY